MLFEKLNILTMERYLRRFGIGKITFFCDQLKYVKNIDDQFFLTNRRGDDKKFKFLS